MIIVSELLPVVKAEDLANRVDIYVDEGALLPKMPGYYLAAAKETWVYRGGACRSVFPRGTAAWRWKWEQ